MNKIILIMGVKLIVIFCFYAQENTNLVLNPSFEKIEGKLKKTGQINAAKYWISPTGLRADLFSKSKEGDIGVPGNLRGKEFAKYGDNYAGVVAYSYNNNKPRTYIQTQLKNSLIAGVEYCVKFDLSLSDLSKYAIDKIGVHIGSSAVSLDRKGDIIFSERSGDFDNVITAMGDKIFNNRYNWKTVCGVYKSQGKEKFLTIGNFYNGKDTKAEKLKKLEDLSGAQFPESYYYIDNVHVTRINEEIGCDCLISKEQNNESIVYQSSFVDNNNSLSLKEKLQRSTVYFDVEKYEIEKSFMEILENVFQILKDNLEISLQLNGHIDESEKEAIKNDPENDNLINLGQYRADRIRDFLIEKGVDSKRLKAMNAGSDNPASKGTSKLSLAKNRRVVFVITD